MYFSKRYFIHSNNSIMWQSNRLFTYPKRLAYIRRAPTNLFPRVPKTVSVCIRARLSANSAKQQPTNPVQQLLWRGRERGRVVVCYYWALSACRLSQSLASCCCCCWSIELSFAPPTYLCPAHSSIFFAQRHDINIYSWNFATVCSTTLCQCPFWYYIDILI